MTALEVYRARIGCFSAVAGGKLKHEKTNCSQYFFENRILSN